MSKTILQRIYDDEAGPGETFLCDDPLCRELNREISDDYDYFRGRMSPEDWKRFEKMDNLISERSCASSYANFTYGFRLGVRMMVEVLADSGGSGEG